MTYTPAFISPTAGLVVPTYQDILDDNINGFLNIYGPTQFVKPSAAIYQLLSLISLKQSDTNLAAQLAYNQSSPFTAVGAGLDRIVKMNGIARLPFTYSSCFVHLTGTIGTVITNGFVQDTNGNLWALPSSVTIPYPGTVNVAAVCTTPGNIAANIGAISIIATPTSGWTAVTNLAAATPGDPVEPDSALRARQAVSVSLPSVTPLAGTIAAILDVPGVVRIAPGYTTFGVVGGSSIENPTSSTDIWGNPPNSISMVVQGGTDADVALAIYRKKTIGCLTNGTTTVLVTDPATGYQQDINFFRPTSVNPFVFILVKPFTGTGIPTTTVAAIKAAIVAYLNTLQIGETVAIGALYYAAMAVNPSLSVPSFGVQLLMTSLAAMAVCGVTWPVGLNTLSFTALLNAPVIGMNVYVYNLGTGRPDVVPPGTVITAIVGDQIFLSHNTTAGVSEGYAVCYNGGLPDVDLPMPHFYSVSAGVSADVLVLDTGI